MSSIKWIDPLRDSRWDELVAHHPLSSIFHTRGWLEALAKTYSYKPVALVIEGGDRQLTAGAAFCRVESWLTGRRLVSLPFSDHCDVLANDTEALALSEALAGTKERFKYIELRPHGVSASLAPFRSCDSYVLHTLDLNRSLDEIFNGFHKDHIRRKIRRSERENLGYEEGRSEALLRAFYDLSVVTRRRHGVPPPPFEWFHHLVNSVGDSAKVRVAFHGGRAVASMLTLRHRDAMVYKYGASDPEFHAAGAMHLLFWRTIQEAHELGCRSLDFGRSELSNEGLIAFKDRWGAERTSLTYWRYPPKTTAAAAAHSNNSLAQHIFSLTPDRVLIAAGRNLYRHFA